MGRLSPRKVTKTECVVSTTEGGSEAHGFSVIEDDNSL